MTVDLGEIGYNVEAARQLQAKPPVLLPLSGVPYAPFSRRRQLAKHWIAALQVLLQWVHE